MRPVIETPVAMPNGSSTPVWSLTAEESRIVSHAPETIAEPIALPPEPKPEIEAAPEAAAEPIVEDPAQPPKKGWWQRTFRADG